MKNLSGIEITTVAYSLRLTSTLQGNELTVCAIASSKAVVFSVFNVPLLTVSILKLDVTTVNKVENVGADVGIVVTMAFAVALTAELSMSFSVLYDTAISSVSTESPTNNTKNAVTKILCAYLLDGS